MIWLFAILLLGACANPLPPSPPVAPSPPVERQIVVIKPALPPLTRSQREQIQRSIAILNALTKSLEISAPAPLP